MHLSSYCAKKMLFSMLNFRENGNLRGKSLFASLRRHLERKPLVKKNGSLQNWLCLGFVWVLLGMGQPAGAGCTFYFRFTRYQFLYAHCRSQVSKQSWRRFLRNHVQRKKSYLKEKRKK